MNDTAVSMYGADKVPAVVGGRMDAEFKDLETLDDGPTMEQMAQKYGISDCDLKKIKRHLNECNSDHDEI